MKKETKDFLTNKGYKKTQFIKGDPFPNENFHSVFTKENNKGYNITICQSEETEGIFHLMASSISKNIYHVKRIICTTDLISSYDTKIKQLIHEHELTISQIKREDFERH